MRTALRDEIIRLGPWHLDVQVTPDISTACSTEASYPPSFGDVSFINPRGAFTHLMTKIYPHGLGGRSFLDCACNCGGYSFWARELGAGATFGFDVRSHWIDQARFLLDRRGDTEGMRFEVCDLYDVSNLGLQPFDVTLFKGIFYHLPDPITGLRIAADLTRELIIVDTATRNGLPDGLLAVAEEDRVAAMSGVHGLNWYPTGPDVIVRVLRWLGFVETRCTYWRRESRDQPETLGRLQIVGSRTPGLLAAVGEQER